MAYFRGLYETETVLQSTIAGYYFFANIWILNKENYCDDCCKQPPVPTNSKWLEDENKQPTLRNRIDRGKTKKNSKRFI